MIKFYLNMKTKKKSVTYSRQIWGPVDVYTDIYIIYVYILYVYVCIYNIYIYIFRCICDIDIYSEGIFCDKKFNVVIKIEVY